MHVHVYCADGEAKFWIEPEVALATQVGLSQKQLNELIEITRDHRDEIADAWRRHFGG